MHLRTHDHPADRPQSGLSKAFQAEIREGLQQWRHGVHEGSELSEPVDPERDHVCGDPASPVVVVEYGCYGSRIGSEEERALRATLREWVQEGRICLAFRHFPMIDSYPEAWLAAQAIEAAGCQGRFWEMQDALTEGLTQRYPKSVDGRVIADLARRLDLDISRLEDDMERASTGERIFRDFNSGVRSGVNGAPTFYVQGVRQDIDEPDDLHARLESALAGDRASLWPPVHRRVDGCVKIARLWHDGLANGDFSPSEPFWADDIEWRGWNEELPSGGAAIGKRAVEDLHRRAHGTISGFTVAAHEYIQHGNRVVVIGQATCDCVDGGFCLPYVQIWEMEAGKAHLVQTLTDTLAIARALAQRAPTSQVLVGA